MGTCPPDSHGLKAFPGTEKGTHWSRFAKRTRDRLQRIRLHFVLNPPDGSAGKSVNETVARLLVPALFPDGNASRTLEDSTLVLFEADAFRKDLG